ncbi:MAG: OmpA family protein, partial [Bacteroidota bacterium]
MSVRRNIFVVFVICLMTQLSFGQGKRLKGDDYFFQYAYKQAITSYEQQLAKGTYLNIQQQLNLADSYYKTNAFDKASKIYLEVFAKDTLMTSLQFNKMLQSFSVQANFKKVDSLLASKKDSFSKELLENMEFNISILKDQAQTQGLDYEIFNVGTNSAQSDFSPAFYGSNVLFSSGRSQDKKKQYAPAGEGYLNIFQAKILNDGQVNNAKVFTGIPASSYHKATPFYGSTLNTVFYVSSNMDDGELVFDEKGKNALSITKMIL